jgi:NAD(P)-dependent dehydrogenase (short-subunit alcohol dehydrogenase family)
MSHTLLADRVVIITGTGKGIGRAVAGRALEAGAHVLAVSRQGSTVSGSVSVTLDVTTEDAPDAILDRCLREFGRVDALVNNAGVIYFADCWTHSDEAWDRLFATNLTAPFRISQCIVNHWLQTGREGTILNMCSVESEIAMPAQAGYAATKGGLLALTRTMALDLAPYGIRVNALGPGVIDTGMSDTFAAHHESHIPLGRLGTPDEVADCAVFLLSDLARYVTGAILYADGGYTLQ